METYKVLLTPRASADLAEIYAYVASHLQEPDTARRLLRGLKESILSLETLPYRCAQRQVGAYAGKGYRQLVYKNFLVVYQVREEEKQVIIATVRYARSEF